MTFAATCMELERITLSEINQKEKDKQWIISLIHKEKKLNRVRKNKGGVEKRLNRGGKSTRHYGDRL